MQLAKIENRKGTQALCVVARIEDISIPFYREEITFLIVHKGIFSFRLKYNIDLKFNINIVQIIMSSRISQQNQICRK